MYSAFNDINEYTEDNNWSKFLALIPGDENKGEIKKMKEAWNKIKYLIQHFKHLIKHQLTNLENNDSGGCDDNT